MDKKAIIIFLKYPELGRAKTRLAATIGDENALTIYKELLNHTHEITKNLEADKFLFYDKVSENKMPWDEHSYFTAYQKESDLGGRMLDAFEQVFNKGYSKVLIVGSDCYELNQNIIEQAFLQLETSDVVIGPAKDGGYYLLGLKSLVKEIFMDVAWSTETVFATTEKILQKLSLKLSLTPTLSDIDTIEDLPETLRELINYSEN